jgi:hypothetical protein
VLVLSAESAASIGIGFEPLLLFAFFRNESARLKQTVGIVWVQHGDLLPHRQGLEASPFL